MEALKIFNWLNPLEPLFNAIAERIDFPVDQVSKKLYTVAVYICLAGQTLTHGEVGSGPRD